MLQHTKQRFSTLYILILEAQLIEVEIYIETVLGNQGYLY